MKEKNEGPLYDAARMLRKASRLVEQYARQDECTTYSMKIKPSKKDIAEAIANVDAAMARIEPYKE